MRTTSVHGNDAGSITATALVLLGLVWLVLIASALYLGAFSRFAERRRAFVDEYVARQKGACVNHETD